MYKIIEETSKSIKNEREPQNVFLQVLEEVGELSKELRVKYDTTSYKQEGKDGILGESCDILISLIDLLILEGYTEEDINKTVVKKCNKWKSKAKQ